MNEQETQQPLILVFYVAIGNLDAEDVRTYMDQFAQLATADKIEGARYYFIPVREGSSRIECINPQLVGPEQYKSVSETLENLNGLIGQYEEGIEKLKQKPDERISEDKAVDVIHLSQKEVELLFESVSLMVDGFFFKEKKFISVTDIIEGRSEQIGEEEVHGCGFKTASKYVEDHIDRHCKGGYRVLRKLKDFQLKWSHKGDHRHDGQFVDYTIDLVSPKGEKTKLEQEMCLAVGFRAHEPVNIKV